MKLDDGVSRRTEVSRPSRSSGLGAHRMSPLPIEWMDPMSWRLPSGKALAEFALQAGFLAPLLLSGPIGLKPPTSRGKSAAAASNVRQMGTGK
jgi:hypothetical protein